LRLLASHPTQLAPIGEWREKIEGVERSILIQFSFPYTDVLSFITLSSVLEGVGTSAYLAGAPLITSKYYLTVAGSILVTEALHASMQRGAINEVPMPNPFGTPLDPTSVYTLAATFITACPASNIALPFVPFPTLALDASVCTCEEPNCSPPMLQKREPWTKTETWETSTKYASPSPTATALSDTCTAPYAGSTAMFTAASAIPAGSFVTFVSGLNVVSVPGTISGMDISAAIPSVAMGQTYVFVTSSDQEGTLSDAAVQFGPAILEVYPAAPLINYSILK
jgi:Ferritin-like domain